MIRLHSFHSIPSDPSLANKLAPSIIFVDEIDCFMRTRNVMEQDYVSRVKTEFMTLWDGLLTGTTAACSAESFKPLGWTSNSFVLLF